MTQQTQAYITATWLALKGIVTGAYVQGDTFDITKDEPLLMSVSGAVKQFNAINEEWLDKDGFGTGFNIAISLVLVDDSGHTVVNTKTLMI